MECSWKRTTTLKKHLGLTRKELLSSDGLMFTIYGTRILKSLKHDTKGQNWNEREIYLSSVSSIVLRNMLKVVIIFKNNPIISNVSISLNNFKYFFRLLSAVRKVRRGTWTGKARYVGIRTCHKCCPT